MDAQRIILWSPSVGVFRSTVNLALLAAERCEVHIGTLLATDPTNQPTHAIRDFMAIDGLTIHSAEPGSILHLDEEQPQIETPTPSDIVDATTLLLPHTTASRAAPTPPAPAITATAYQLLAHLLPSAAHWEIDPLVEWRNYIADSRREFHALVDDLVVDAWNASGDTQSERFIRHASHAIERELEDVERLVSSARPSMRNLLSVPSAVDGAITVTGLLVAGLANPLVAGYTGIGLATGRLLYGAWETFKRGSDSRGHRLYWLYHLRNSVVERPRTVPFQRPPPATEGPTVSRHDWLAALEVDLEVSIADDGSDSVSAATPWGGELRADLSGRCLDRDDILGHLRSAADTDDLLLASAGGFTDPGWLEGRLNGVDMLDGAAPLGPGFFTFSAGADDRTPLHLLPFLGPDTDITDVEGLSIFGRFRDLVTDSIVIRVASTRRNVGVTNIRAATELATSTHRQLHAVSRRSFTKEAMRYAEANGVALWTLEGGSYPEPVNDTADDWEDQRDDYFEDEATWTDARMFATEILEDLIDLEIIESDPARSTIRGLPGRGFEVFLPDVVLRIVWDLIPEDVEGVARAAEATDRRSALICHTLPAQAKSLCTEKGVIAIDETGSEQEDELAALLRLDQAPQKP